MASRRIGTVSETELNGRQIDRSLKKHEQWGKPNFTLDWGSSETEAEAHWMLDRHAEIARDILTLDSEEQAKRLKFGHETLDRWFGEFKDPSFAAKRAFVVGRRESAFGRPGADTSESDDFFPSLANEMGGTPRARARFLDHMPPAVLARSGEEGVIVLTQLNPDMEKYAIKHEAAVLGMGLRAIQTATRFTHERGVNILGLAGKIAGQSRFGEFFRTTPGVEGMHTTSGHGGTVDLIDQTVARVMERGDFADEDTVGIIGVGSIGFSTASLLLDDKNGQKSQVRKIVAYDTRPEKVKALQEYDDSGRVEDAGDLLALLQNEKVRVIVSAVTGFIDLNELEKEHGCKIDLAGKVIIDDSQPPCFLQEQIEARNGILQWVVGNDESVDQFATRQGSELSYSKRPFSFGGAGIGLAELSNVFGCEAELAALSSTNKLDLALTRPVTPDEVRVLSKIIRDAGIRASKPQAYGRLIEWSDDRDGNPPSSMAA